jgi:hypothetical protein
VERLACGVCPVPGVGRSRIVIGDIMRSKESPRGDLATHNRSIFDHAPLYAVLILARGLGIAATPMVLFALLLF